MIIKVNDELFNEKIGESPAIYPLGMGGTLVIHDGKVCLNVLGSTLLLGEILDEDTGEYIIQSGPGYLYNLDTATPTMTSDINEAMRLTRVAALEMQVRLTNAGLASRMIPVPEVDRG